MNKLMRVSALTGLALAAGAGQAGTGKLLLTGGVSTIAGSAGGGLTPWAVIGTNATEGELGVSAHLTQVKTQDYQLNSAGLALGLMERLELSLARQDFDASPAVALNGVAGQHLKMNVVGLKFKVAGDAVLDSDSLMPQIAVGLEHKSLQAGTFSPVLRSLGTQHSGTDFYVSATKLLLDNGLLLNATLRSTNANQNGLLGFGSAAPGRSGRSWQPEFSVAYLLSRHVAIGAEYRAKPNNLQALGVAAGLGDGLREEDWKDLFVAWAPNKHFSLTAAYVDLGRVVPGITAGRRQTGYYLSGQIAY